MLVGGVWVEGRGGRGGRRDKRAMRGSWRWGREKDESGRNGCVLGRHREERGGRKELLKS